MKLLILYSVLGLLVSSAFAFEVDKVFENQKKASFPDTVEIQMRTTVTLSGLPEQKMEMSILNSGKEKSVTKIQSAQVNMKIVKNKNLVAMVDLKTGTKLPVQNVPDQNNPLDLEKQMGNANDYQTPVKENGLWKLVPKEAGKPTLYYSEKEKRIVKMMVNINGSVSESSFTYCKNECSLPGTLSSVTILSALPGNAQSKVLVEVLSAKKRSNLPEALFSVK
jgi:hypothetical protein